MLKYDYSAENNLAYKMIAKDINKNHFSNSYLLVSNDSMLIENISLLIARLAMCKSNACGECSICKNIEKKRDIDLIFYDGLSAYTVDTIREINNACQTRPFESNRKIVVLLGMEEMSTVCQNALLKTLEEPPFYVHFLLGTKNLSNILPTIKSRSKTFEISELPTSIILNQLKEMGIAKENIIEIANASCGNLTLANELLNSESLVLLDFVFSLIDNVNGSKDIAEWSYKTQAQKSTKKIFELLSMVFRDVLMTKTNNDQLVFFKNKLEKTKMFSNMSMHGLCELTELCDLSRNKLNLNISEMQVTDAFLWKLAEVKSKCTK